MEESPDSLSGVSVPPSRLATGVLAASLAGCSSCPSPLLLALLCAAALPLWAAPAPAPHACEHARQLDASERGTCGMVISHGRTRAVAVSQRIGGNEGVSHSPRRGEKGFHCQATQCYTKQQQQHPISDPSPRRRGAQCHVGGAQWRCRVTSTRLLVQKKNSCTFNLLLAAACLLPAACCRLSWQRSSFWALPGPGAVPLPCLRVWHLSTRCCGHGAADCKQ